LEGNEPAEDEPAARNKHETADITQHQVSREYDLQDNDEGKSTPNTEMEDAEKTPTPA